MNFAADNGLVDLVFGTRDRLVVDCRADHFMDSGIMMAILDPGHCQ